MVDIHTHVLPRFDDGPQSIEDSIELIKELKKCGVTDIVSTSHYYSHTTSLEDFVDRRARRLAELKDAMAKENLSLNIILGAEVNISKLLLNLDSVKDLCIGSGNKILLEIPHREDSLDDAVELIEKITSYYNVVPIVAHVERYSFFVKKLKNLSYLRDMGCYVQLDAECLTNGFAYKRFALKAIDEGYVDVIASDCHDTADRGPNINTAYDIIAKKLGDDMVNMLKENAVQLIK